VSPRGARSAISHSGVAGLRARPKPERFWFNSRGWDRRRRFKVTGWCATPASMGSIPIACSKRQGAALAIAGGRVVVDTLVFQTRPPGSIPTARSISRGLSPRSLIDSSCALPIGRAQHDRVAVDMHVSIATTRPGGRRASAPGRAVVTRSTGNLGQLVGRDDVERKVRIADPDDAGMRAGSISTRRRVRSLADFARAGSFRSTLLQRRRGRRPLPVWRHTGIWDRSSAG
jgi:hypothetical protein